jgi:capsular exopolysaccharide synthesis family protein
MDGRSNGKDTVAKTGFVTVASADPGAPFIEAYGMLLASLLLGSNGKPPSTVAVASARAGDGCSTTALNLAIMMAQTGRATVLVDANMRSPGLHTAFDVPQRPGLAEVLTKKSDAKSAIVGTRIVNLSIMPAGNAEVPPQALLTQTSLADLFQTMRERFEMIVVDTPPILSCPDVLHISKVVDGVLMVVSPHGASRRDQQEARQLLDRVEARIFGMVLNRARSRAASRA